MARFNKFTSNKLNKLVCKLHAALKRAISYKEEHFLNAIFKNYIENNSRTDRILNLKAYDLPEDVIGERDLPSNERFQKNGWWEKMLLRYGLAMYFSKEKKILETCSGVGWGGVLTY